MLRLKELEKQHPEWVTSDSPTQKIGGKAKREAGVSVTHNVPMLSIQDVFSEEEVTEIVTSNLFDPEDNNVPCIYGPPEALE